MKLSHVLEDKYGNLSEFKKRSRCPVSMETCRKLIYLEHPVSAESLVLVLKYLGFTAKQIKGYLNEGTKSKHLIQKPDNLQMARDLAGLIGESDVSLTIADENTLKIHRKILEHKDAYDVCVAFMDTINKAYNLGLEKEIAMFDARKGKYGGL